MPAGKLMAKLMEAWESFKKIGADDPRRIVHSMKVGLALTFVSLFYYYRPLYDDFGQAGMWAILTVVVVFEYTVGGTLGKCINRGFATLLGGALGVGAACLTSLCGQKGEPFALAILVFLFASASTFTRFLPRVKRRYDYGVVIFILTFSLIAVSGFRVDEILQLAHQRFSTILIGGATCMLISVSVCPVWAGEDLHDSTAANLQLLADFLQGFSGEPILSGLRGESHAASTKGDGIPNKSYLKTYESAMNSKSAHESLANLAWWEPSHGRFRLRHPWNQYLKIGALARESACLMNTLVGCINPKPKVLHLNIELEIQHACTQMCIESSKALTELSFAVKGMTFPSPDSETHINSAKSIADDLKTVLKRSTFSTKSDVSELMPLLVVASVLIDIAKYTDEISTAVGELARKAGFEASKPRQTSFLHRGMVKPVGDQITEPPYRDDGDEFHVIEISEILVPENKILVPENKNPAS